MPERDQPTRRMIPGPVRIVLQLYDAPHTSYREAGMSLSRVQVANQGELRRLWKAVQNVVEDREWTDRARERAAAEAGA